MGTVRRRGRLVGEGEYYLERRKMEKASSVKREEAL